MVIQVHQDIQAYLVIQVILVNQVIVVFLDIPVNQVILDSQANQDFLV